MLDEHPTVLYHNPVYHVTLACLMTCESYMGSAYTLAQVAPWYAERLGVSCVVGTGNYAAVLLAVVVSHASIPSAATASGLALRGTQD